MLAPAFCHLQYNMHMICQACSHIFSHSSLSTNQLTRKHSASQSVGGQGHVSPKINKPLFKSCNSIKQIFIISAYCSVARKYLSFICLWITVRYTPICIHSLYVPGRFLCVCVLCAQICIYVLSSVGSSRNQANPRHRHCSLFVGT